MKCVITLLWNTLLDWVRWKLKEKICVSIYQRMKAQDPLISEIPEANDPYLDPLFVFEDTKVGQDVSRFVAFAVWLRKHSSSFHWYKVIERRFPKQVPSIARLILERFRGI